MENKCNDNLYSKPIERCSINALNKLKLKTNNDSKYSLNNSNNSLFKEDLTTSLTDLNINFRDPSTNNFIFEYNGVEERTKNLCGETNNIGEYYLNCVLETGNPLFTYKDGYCMIPSEFNLPPELKKIEEKDEIFIKLNMKELEDEEGNFKYEKIQNNKYCEDRWFDWIVIPNYHLGNRILKDSGSFSKEDVKICYNNCKAGELPYVNTTGSNLCIPKEYAYEGKYENKLDYSPIALINLIGNNKDSLFMLFNNLYKYKLNKKLNKYDINIDTNLNLDKSDNYIINEVFDEIKKVLNTIVNDNILDIPDFSLEYRYLTYKHQNFKENDLITILGMDKNEILSNDIILIHTVYIAYRYKEFLDNIQNNETFFDDKDDKSNIILNITKHNKNRYNIFDVLNDLDINHTNSDKTKEKRHRLANILYKAINICYDNKTDFSKNLIDRTKKAIDNYTTKIKGEIEKEFKYVALYYDFFKEQSNRDKIINGFNIEYYKFDELNKINEKIDKKIDQYKDIITIFNFKDNYIRNFIFYTEEQNEIIKNNKCISGEFLENNICVKCRNECNDIEKCKNNSNCKIYCDIDCKNFSSKDEKTKCGGRETEENKKPLIEKTNEIMTPVEEETNIPDFIYIFKTAVKIFFILIVIYVGYLFYTIFNESILTFLNSIYGFFEWIYHLFTNKIKTAEYYEKNIQDKYNRVIRKTMI